MSMNEVVSLSTPSGEFVGKYLAEDVNSVTLEDPRLVMASQKGLGFGNGVTMTGKENPDKVTFNNYICYVPVDPEVERAYRSAVSGLVL